MENGEMFVLVLTQLKGLNIRWVRFGSFEFIPDLSCGDRNCRKYTVQNLTGQRCCVKYLLAKIIALLAASDAQWGNAWQ